jgi:hypothetical protein
MCMVGRRGPSKYMETVPKSEDGIASQRCSLPRGLRWHLAEEAPHSVHDVVLSVRNWNRKIG